LLGNSLSCAFKPWQIGHLFTSKLTFNLHKAVLRHLKIVLQAWDDPFNPTAPANR
jgi:hypothetical protein